MSRRRCKQVGKRVKLRYERREEVGGQVPLKYEGLERNLPSRMALSSSIGRDRWNKEKVLREGHVTKSHL